MIPTPFRNYRPLAKGFHLIDTFFASTEEKPKRNLYRTLSGSAGHGRRKNKIMIPKNHFYLFIEE